MLLLPTIFLHAVCIFTAASQCPPADAPKYNPGLSHPLSKSLDKHIDQIMFIGAHNAGANQKVRGVPSALTCWARNQEATFYGMLQLGVRYLDLDVCYRNRVLRFCHTKKQIAKLKGPYFGKVRRVFEDVNCFVNQHPKEIVFLHFNRDYIAFGRAANRPKLAKALFELFELYKDIIFPLGEFKRQKGRFPTVREVLDSGKPVLIFVTEGLHQLAREVEPRIREFPTVTERDLMILYLAYGVKNKQGEWQVADTKMNHIRETCRNSDERFLDFQVIGKPSNVKVCNPTLALASNSVAIEALEVCRRERCNTTGGEIGINFLTIDYVNFGPEDLFDYYNFGRCDLPDKKKVASKQQP